VAYFFGPPCTARWMSFTISAYYN